ncbi:MAG TPA: methyltransferase, partial [Myxococcota bacterium]|nr:methyltransferase [Myxococcota bacterium]
ALDVALPRLRPDGLVLADNVLWGGRTARGETDASTSALITYNQRIFHDPRLSSVIVPVGDGLAISRKQ